MQTVNQPVEAALFAVTEEVNPAKRSNLQDKEPKMNKLLSVLLAGVIATVSSVGFAQDKKADAPKADAPKAEMKKDAPMKKEKKEKKAKKEKKTKPEAKK